MGTAMTKQSPLLSKTGHLDESYVFLTDAQLAKLAEWSIITERDVLTLLRQSKFICKSYGDGSDVMLEGVLPNCGLYGALLPDGSTHT